MGYVTDPAVLAQLNGAPAPQFVTDPEILAQLNGSNVAVNKAGAFHNNGGIAAKDDIFTQAAGGAKHAFDQMAYGIGRRIPDLPKSVLSDETRDKYNNHGLTRFLGAQLPSNQNMKDRTAAGKDYVDHAGVAGNVGNIVGEAALMAPIMGLTGGAGPALGLGRGLVSSAIGTGGAGAAYGAITSPDNTFSGAAKGAAGAVAGQVLGHGIIKGLGAGGDVISSMYGAGRERLLKDSLAKYAGTDAATLANTIARNNTELVPGVKPTLGEVAGSSQLSGLQRSLATKDPALADALHTARRAQVDGYKSVLDDMQGGAGTRPAYQAALANREATSGALYKRADESVLQRTPELDAMRDRLLTRPSVIDSIGRPPAPGQTPAQGTAHRIAAEEGLDFTGGAGSVRGLGLVVRNLQGKIDNAYLNDTAAAPGIKATKRELAAYLEKASPEYGAARDSFRELSKPVNQMEVAKALRDKIFPGLTDHSDDLLRVNGNTYAQGLRNDGDATVKAALGRDIPMTQVMTPAQMRSLNGVADEAARYAAHQQRGLVAGSTTSQNEGVTASLNTTGLGAAVGASLPKGWLIQKAFSHFLDTVGNKISGQARTAMLNRAITDPSYAIEVLRNSNGSLGGDVASKLGLDRLSARASGYVPQGVKNFTANKIRPALPDSAGDALINVLRAGGANMSN